MMSTLRFWIALGVFLALSCGAQSLAHAQGTSAAEALYIEGHEAMEAKDYDTACAKFQASYEVANTTGPLQGLAGCEEARGNDARSLGLWRTAKARLPADSPSLPDVNASIARLDGIVARVKLTPSAGAPTDMKVTMGGAVVSLDGAEHLVDPDVDQVLVVTADQFHERSETLRFRRGESRSIEISPGPPMRVAPDPSPERPDAPPPDNTLRTVGFIVGGVGVVGAVVAIVTGVVMINASSDIDDACGDRSRCADPDAAQEAKERAEGLGVLNAVSLGVGVAGVAAGLVLVLWPVDDAPGSTGLRITPGLGSLSLSGHF